MTAEIHLKCTYCVELHKKSPPVRKLLNRIVTMVKCRYFLPNWSE